LINQAFFCNSFRFRTISLRQQRHTDNSAGLPSHFVARMRRGTGLIRTLAGEELHLTAGDAFFLPMGLCYHSYWTPDESGVVEWDSFGFCFVPSPDELRYDMQRFSLSPETSRLFDSLAAQKETSSLSVGLLYLLLHEISPLLSSGGGAPQAALLARAVHYMTDHPDFKVGEVARHCGMSESGFYAFFRKRAGCTPVEMKHQIKLQRAMEWLSTTDLSVEEISERLGFCSAAYFRKVMKRACGKSPMELRREQYKKEGI